MDIVARRNGRISPAGYHDTQDMGSVHRRMLDDLDDDRGRGLSFLGHYCRLHKGNEAMISKITTFILILQAAYFLSFGAIMQRTIEDNAKMHSLLHLNLYQLSRISIMPDEG